MVRERRRFWGEVVAEELPLPLPPVHPKEEKEEAVRDVELK